LISQVKFVWEILMWLVLFKAWKTAHAVWFWCSFGLFLVGFSVFVVSFLQCCSQLSRVTSYTPVVLLFKVLIKTDLSFKCSYVTCLLDILYILIMVLQSWPFLGKPFKSADDSPFTWEDGLTAVLLLAKPFINCFGTICIRSTGKSPVITCWRGHITTYQSDMIRSVNWFLSRACTLVM